MNLKSLNFIDLFSGAGGLSCGLELAGHKCLLGVDFFKDAMTTFKANHKHAEVFHGDIKKLTEQRFVELTKGVKIDMVVGSPPCQGLSTVGKGDPKDARNQLFKQYVRLVKFIDPKIIVMENVTGLIASKNAKVLKGIFKEFEALGYNMSARVLSSEDYGVPEKRRRAIIIGVKGGVPLFPIKTHGPGKLPLKTVKEAFKEIKKNSPNHDPRLVQLSPGLDLERLKFIPAGKGIRYEKDEKAYLPKKLYYNHDWSELAENRFRQTRLQRLPLNDVSPTILTQKTTYYHPTENRYLTPREAASCQSFPVDYEFHGSLNAQFKQIGNAVPPLMAKAIGEALKKIKFDGKVVKSEALVVKGNVFNYQKKIEE